MSFFADFKSVLAIFVDFFVKVILLIIFTIFFDTKIRALGITPYKCIIVTLRTYTIISLDDSNTKYFIFFIAECSTP